MELWNVRLRYRGRHPMEMMWEHECRSCTLYVVPCTLYLSPSYHICTDDQIENKHGKRRCCQR